MSLSKKVIPEKLQFSILFLLLLVGTFLPTKIFQWMKLEVIYLAPVMVLTVLFLWLGKLKWLDVTLFAIVNGLLWLFTYLSPLRFSFGEAVYYSVMLFTVTLVFQIQFPEKIWENFSTKVAITSFQGFSWIILLAGYSVWFHFKPVTDFLIKYYPYFYGGLIESMTYQGKPVLTFTTHSLAGFYMFLFLVMHLFAFIKKRSAMDLVQVFAFLGLLVALRSTTSLLYLLLALVLIAITFFLWSPKVFFWFIGGGLLVGGFVAYKEQLFQKLVENLIGTESVNGLGARYRKDGAVYPQVKAVLKSPFVGSGTRSKDGVFYIDSGIFHLGQRIGVIGTLSFYTLFFRFWKKNTSWLITLGLFSFFFIFEFAFSNLFYFRTIYMLPFIVFFFTLLGKEKNELFLRGYKHAVK